MVFTSTSVHVRDVSAQRFYICLHPCAFILLRNFLFPRGLNEENGAVSKISCIFTRDWTLKIATGCTMTAPKDSKRLYACRQEKQNDSFLRTLSQNCRFRRTLRQTGIFRRTLSQTGVFRGTLSQIGVLGRTLHQNGGF